MTDLPPEIPDALPPSSGRRILWIALVVIVLGAAGAAVALRRRPSPGLISTTGNTNRSVQTGPIASPSVTTPDADGDRLTDQEEADLRIDPQNGDTDADGLGDYEEARVWQTDPKRIDTDGDGVRDGDEVRRGTSPTGPSLLRDPAAITNAAND